MNSPLARDFDEEARTSAQDPSTKPTRFADLEAAEAAGWIRLRDLASMKILPKGITVAIGTRYSGGILEDLPDRSFLTLWRATSVYLLRTNTHGTALPGTVWMIDRDQLPELELRLKEASERTEAELDAIARNIAAQVNQEWMSHCRRKKHAPVRDRGTDR